MMIVWVPAPAECTVDLSSLELATIPAYLESSCVFEFSLFNVWSVCHTADGVSTT